jgi:hypothetical protein
LANALSGIDDQFAPGTIISLHQYIAATSASN